MNKLTTNKSKILKLTNVLKYQCLLRENESPSQNLVISVREREVIDPALLKQIYEKKQTLEVVGEGYRLIVEGREILNMNNALYTDIDLQTTANGTDFTLNRGEDLYLYHETKKKYEQIEIETTGEFQLELSGKYLLSVETLRGSREGMTYVLIGGCVILLLCSAGYIIVKKRYWFW